MQDSVSNLPLFSRYLRTTNVIIYHHLSTAEAQPEAIVNIEHTLTHLALTRLYAGHIKPFGGKIWGAVLGVFRCHFFIP